MLHENNSHNAPWSTRAESLHLSNKLVETEIYSNKQSGRLLSLLLLKSNRLETCVSIMLLKSCCVSD